MSYNIIDIETLESTLKIESRVLKALLKAYEDELPEDCFLFDLEITSEVIDIDNIQWAGVYSGHTYKHLKEILLKDVTGTGKFVIHWEDGAITGLKITTDGNRRIVKEVDPDIIID